MTTKTRCYFLSACLLLLGASTVHAQIDEKMDRMKELMEDVFNEEENDLMTLRFYDAVSGNPIEDASVLIENIGQLTTDLEGRVLFDKQPDGLLRAIFSKPGYIKTQFKVDVVAETIFKNRFVVSPVMDIQQFRVVLDWEQKPADLDAHFVKRDVYHISYRDTRVLADGTGQLDRDDMDGYGPETITVQSLDANADYSYFVYNYSDHSRPQRPSLAQSKASVRVYGNNQLLQTFEVPTELQGKIWNVFVVRNGQVIPAQN